MALAALVIVSIAVACIGFFTAGVGRLVGEFLIGVMSRSKPVPRAAAFMLRLVSWISGYVFGGILTWQRSWEGMHGDGSGIYLPGAPSQPVSFGAVILGFVLLWLSSWMARSRGSRHA